MFVSHGLFAAAQSVWPFSYTLQPDSGPRRISLRQQGIQADGSRIDHEKRNGEV